LDEEPIPQDFTEDLYSRDEQKRMEAFQKIFETSELLAAEDLFMDDLREFDRNTEFDETYKTKIKNLPKGKWGKIQMRKEDEEFVHLAHLMDNKNEAGYFVAFSKDKIGELLTTSEGLLYIKATSDQNERFKDKFKNKPESEEYILSFIQQYQFAEDDHINRYNEPQTAAIGFLVNKMQEYGYAVDEIEKVYNCIIYSQNAYINKQNMKLVRQINRMTRRNEHVGDEVIKHFISLAHQYRPDEKTEKAPLEEVIQIFA
jgi:hypothetical protein